MPKALNLYYGNQLYNPSLKLYLNPEIAVTQAYVEDIVAPVLPFMHSSISFDRWTVSMDNVGTVQTGILQAVGTAEGEILPFKFCAFLLMTTNDELGTPSSKYIHGIVEGAMTNGGPSLGYLLAVSALGNQWSGLEIQNSNGTPITGVIHRGFTRRRKVRRRD